MAKNVSIPSPVRTSQQAENWVQGRVREPVKRLTIELPAQLHAQVKAKCALDGVKMKDLVRTLLERECAQSS